MIFNREPMRSFEIQSRRQRIKITFKNASQLVNSASRRRLLAYMRLASHLLGPVGRMQLGNMAYGGLHVVKRVPSGNIAPVAITYYC